jgi:hypothetical protein
VRRNVLCAAGVTLVLAGAWACRRPLPPVSKGDVFSGCRSGALQVKILIHLQPTEAGACRAEVTPASVCVAPGGRVDFKVHNRCEALAGRPALRITEPQLRRKLDGTRPDPSAPPLPRLLTDCTLEFGSIPRSDAAATASCIVDPRALEGFYKYGLEGQIDPLDPDIEVRKP